MNRTSGLFLAAGRDVLDTGTFIEAVLALPGSRLDVDWQDDGGTDECLYDPSPKLLPLLTPFSEMLAQLWREKPDWVV